MKSFKKIGIIFFLSCIIFKFHGVLADDPIKVLIDDKQLQMDVLPVIQDDRTLIPLRAAFEALGASVDWDPSTETVTAKKDTTTVVLKINDTHPKVNGKEQKIDVPAILINDRTMVPIRFVATSFGTYVEWDENTNSVLITTPKVIAFKDENLEKVIRKKLSIQNGDIKNTDVMGITELDASGSQITDITGLEYCKSLTKLNLSKNNISTIIPLQGLKKLNDLNLNNNKISNIYNLRELKKLQKLSLSSNKISSFAVLSELPNLIELKIQYNPLTELSNITKFSRYTKIYLIDGNFPLEKTDKATLDEYEKVISKAAEIVKNNIKENMSDLEKEYILHDYLILNSKYDIESYINLIPSDFCHTAYGALVQGKSVCDGYAKAMEILLNMAGVECITVTGTSYSYAGRPIGHAWNIVKIDGESYHLDASADDLDGDGGDISHYYFNLSDSQISLGRAWNTVIYPKCNKDNADFESLNKLVRLSAFSDGYFFEISKNNLYKIDSETSKATLLVDDKAWQLQLQGGWIYYINKSDGDYVYKVKTDGSNRTKVCEKPSGHILINNNYLYLISTYDNQLYKLDLNKGADYIEKVETGNFTTYIFEMNNSVYYRTYSFTYKGSIAKIIDNNRKYDIIVNDTPAGYRENGNSVSYNYGLFERISGDYLYYINASDNTLYRVKCDGSGKSQISRSTIDSQVFGLSGDYVYFKNSDDNNKLYRAKIDGSGEVCLQ